MKFTLVSLKNIFYKLRYNYMKKIVSNIAILLSIATIVSCDKDFNTIGSEVIGDDHFDFLIKDDVTLSAYTKRTGAVQSNNLPINSLGIYVDPYFGTTKSTFVSQLELSSIAPYFGNIREIQSTDSIYLYVPYFSEQTATGSGIEPNTFKLKSVYGDSDNATLDLKIFENGYFLRNYNAADPSISQKYYSDEKTSLIENNLASAQLNDGSNLSENTQFKFNKEEIIIYKTNGSGAYLDSNGAVTTDDSKRVVKERLSPGMWINLNKSFFETKVLNAPDSKLINNNLFKEYFKGLYFQVDANSSGNSNALALLDFSKAYITMQYHTKEAATDEFKKKTFKLNLKGNTINFFENTFSSEYNDELTNTNAPNTDEFLYPKGGDGSVVFIDLFGDDDAGDDDLIPEELEELRSQSILINEAYLTFYVKNEGQKNPTRIFLYDATNNTPILDYIFDSSTATDPANNKFSYGGILEVVENVDTKYKIRLSSHINNLIKGTNPNTNKNVRLGLSVTQNINNGNRYDIKDSTLFGNTNLPIGSIMSPLGTILYGNHPSTDPSKKMKFEIYYTKPN